MAQRQFRSDDTSKWVDGFGNSSDGAFSPSTGTDAPIDSAATGTSGTSSLTATNASFASGQIILIHQTQGTGAGAWELNKIASYVSGTITTSYTLINTYSTGAQVLVLKQYSTASIGGGVTYTAKAWTGTVGGIMAFLANTSFSGTGTLVLGGKGYRGGAAPSGTNGGFRGEGTTADNSVAQTTANGNGGGGGGGGAAGVGAGGAGGGHSATGTGGSAGEGTGGTGGASAGTASLVTMVMGGGAGAGQSSADNSGTRSAGGNGGAILIIISKSIDVSGMAGIGIDGTVGGSASARNGFGGGGAGGAALLKGQTIILGTVKITAAAGAAGSGGGSTGAAGGAGTTGRIHADYKTSISGTTTPTIDSTQDSTLNDPSAGGAFLYNLL